MIAGLALCLFAGEVHHVDASLELPGDLIDHRFVDVVGDGRLELVVALRMPGGGRELRMHRIAGVRVEPEPFVRVPVLRDVVAYGFADVRAESGRELLFLTRGGVHSYSTTIDGLRDNVERLIASELIYDVPDPRALPGWEYVLPGPGKDRVLVPGIDGLELWGPPVDREADPSAGYRRLVTIESGRASFRRLRQRNDERSEARVELRGSRGPFFHDSFLDDAGPEPQAFLGDSRAVRAPALADVDGDGRLDLVLWDPPMLSLYLDRGPGIPAEPTRVEELPEYLRTTEGRLDMELVDLDGDGALDLLVQRRVGGDGLKNADYSLFVLLQREGRMFPAQPDQILRFQAATLRVEVVDVNGDGRPDLAVRQFELPNLMGSVKGLEFDLTYLLYLGQGPGGRPFERKPALRRRERFDENSVAAAAANRKHAMDCDGDGIPDLVEVDLSGYVTIRRLRLESSFLRGKSWSLDEVPWKRFAVRGDIDSLEVLDLNGDGLGDIVSSGRRTLAILLSMDGRKQRSGR